MFTLAGPPSAVKLTWASISQTWRSSPGVQGTSNCTWRWMLRAAPETSRRATIR